MSTATDHARTYWEYQYRVAREHMAPLLERWGVTLAGCTVLDVGCGSGGGTCAMADLGARCTGYDVNSRLIDEANALKGDRPVIFSTADVYRDAHADAGSIDLIVLHDVFEHLDRKEEMMEKLGRTMRPDGRLLITFPPYYSAYGAHQQHLRAPFARLPFFHLLPFALSWIVPALRNEHPYVMEEVTKLGRHRMGMRKFEAIARRAGMTIVGKEAYVVSPNHIRFGLKPLPAGPLAEIPVLGEILCTGVVYLVTRNP